MATLAKACWRVKWAQPMLALLSLVMVSDFVECASASAQGAATVYKEKCSGCHTIGGGNLVGPDLARSATWPDAKLEAAIKRMESNTGPLTEAEVRSLVVYLKAAKSEAGVSKDSPPPGVEASASSPSPGSQNMPEVPTNSKREPASAERGRRLFYGDEAFKNGGLSCISCHSIDRSGGNMAPDLTLISSKMQPAALVSACEQTPYKVMKSAYKDHAIQHQEALDLQTYLYTLKEPHDKEKKLPVGLLGGGLSAAILALIAAGYRGRNKSARSKLHRRD